MLKRIKKELSLENAKTIIKEAHFPAPFYQGLEFSSPARGTWNIVHTGMLIPESHQIFVCAQGCLRGVVLTAAEMNAMDRYSSILIQEENVLDGSMENLMIEGVTDILDKLPYRPKAILLFISCQHFFLAYDQNLVFETLRRRFPDIKFLDCYMIPTLRKSGLTPDQKMRLQLFKLLEDRKKDKKKINLIGSNLPILKESELVTFLQQKGYQLQTINWCKNFEEYMDLSDAFLNLIYEPIALPSAEELKDRIHQDYLYLPFVFSMDGLEESYKALCEKLSLPFHQAWFDCYKQKAKKAISHAKDLIGNTKIAIDYTFTFRILSFTRMLLEEGFLVNEIYVDAFLPEEKKDFDWIKEHFPQIQILATNQPEMRYIKKEREEKILAIGQKAAYFTGTDYFVNIVESGGFYGWEGICNIMEAMEDAFCHPKDRKDIIQRKGYGCESCI